MNKRELLLHVIGTFSKLLDYINETSDIEHGTRVDLIMKKSTDISKSITVDINQEELNYIMTIINACDEERKNTLRDSRYRNEIEELYYDISTYIASLHKELNKLHLI